MKFIDLFWSQYLKLAKSEIDYFNNNAMEVQWNQLKKILNIAENTEWGKKYLFNTIQNTDQWKNKVPIQNYDSIKSDIHRMMTGESNILWPGTVSNFAKSSGTTSDKSKFIPITKENHKECHTQGGIKLMAVIYDQVENVEILSGKTIVLAGSTQNNSLEYPNTVIGDVSAVIYRNLSRILKSFLVPEEQYNLLDDSDLKLDIIAEKSLYEDVRMMAGSPTWMLILCKKMLKLSGKSNMIEIWPNFKILIHGAVSFVPYRRTFEDIFPSKEVYYFETYNASEGYFAVQDKANSNELLLLLDLGIFYEFIPSEEFDNPDPKTHLIDEVELDKQYSIVITTNSGLYRYEIGDTIQFTNLKPYRFKISGRTKQYLNVFGEELMVSNTDEAISKTSKHFSVKVKDYTVAPIFQSQSNKGGHEWIIEFEDQAPDSEEFAEFLDKTIQSLNSDYEAKRFKNLALERLRLHIAKQDCFSEWMKATNRIGTQKKVPRLANHRSYLDEILAFA
ncbi:MAG: GH3 auxin-responsive promoter family protein [Saprospiraceae bacterium]